MLIGEKPRHGYDIIKSIEESVGGVYVPSPGVIYPVLTMLEEMEYTTAVPATDGKRVYTITEAGKTYLKSEDATVQDLRSKLQRLKADGNVVPAPELVRAMHNLKLALHLRMMHKPISPEQSRAVSEAIDALALTVERME